MVDRVYFLHQIPRSTSHGVSLLPQHDPPILTESQPIVMLNFTGVGDPDLYEDVWTSFREAAKPSMEQTVGELSIRDLSHSFDDALLKGPPRVMNAGCVVTNLWSGMAEELWQTFITYTASSPDVVDSMIALEFHATRRNRPVRMHDRRAASPLGRSHPGSAQYGICKF